MFERGCARCCELLLVEAVGVLPFCFHRDRNRVKHVDMSRMILRKNGQKYFDVKF